MAPLEHLRPDESMWDWIASDLRFYREREGLSYAQLGRIIDAARGTVSNIEHRQPRFMLREDQAVKLDKHWELNGHFRRLLLYARLGHNPDWYIEHIHHEARASVLRIYEALLIPGLLQTPDYARTTLRDTSPSLDAEVEERMARQAILTGDAPPDLSVILYEAALRSAVGGPTVMAEQLTRLLELCSTPRMTIRVIPMSEGWHLGLHGAFKLMTVDRETMAYSESCGGGRLIRDPEEVMRLEVQYDRIGAHALPIGASAQMIQQILEDTK